jgi:hypothetical protein
MSSFSTACEITAPTLRSADLRVRGCLPSAQGLLFSKRFFNSVNSLKRGRLASVPAPLSIRFCCPVPHCLTTWSDVVRKNSQAPLNTLQHLRQLATAVALQRNPAWSFSSLCLFLGQESAVSTEFSTTATGRLFQLHLASGYSKTLAQIAVIKRRNINYREYCRC